MITFNCNTCQEDGNCTCLAISLERKRMKKVNSEAYIPGNVIAINDILKNVSLSDLWPSPEWRVYDTHIGGVLVWLEYKEKDVDSDQICTQATREWFIKDKSTESEVLRTIHKLLLGSMEHRVDEHFTYKGQRIYNPHREVAK
jgi:hypothetical protein